MTVNKLVKVIGGGLAGSECALALAKRGYKVLLYDMKPIKKSPAHHMDTLCELVCSNSLKSVALSTGSGVLKKELELLGSEVLLSANECAVPAGHALAVDRDKFSALVHQKLIDFGVEIKAELVSEIDEECTTVIATGPLTDSALEPVIEKISGKRPYFFDAAAPIVTGESIDMNRAFFGGRYGKGGDDYLNLPMTKDEYLEFYNALITAECCEVKGFDAYCESTVLPGSGLSSSAAYEVLIGTILNGLFFDKKLSAIEIAQVGQYAENVFFGKPCGLMDQMASSVGGMVFIDFEDPKTPVVEKIDFDFAAANHALCIIDTGADHADLTDEYAAVPGELKALCAVLGEGELRSIPKIDFYSNIQRLREEVGDRAVLRAIHIYDENQRVKLQKRALQAGDFASFLSYVTESGLSSWRYLQNVIPAGRKEKQEVAFALTIAEKLLNGRGACRVHGGGFAGTIQAFVPNDLLEEFKNGIESVLGEGSCYVLSIRPQGGVEMEAEV